MSMTGLLFGFAMVDNLLLLFINVYNIITLSDLETDLMNVRQCCDKLNQTFIPEIALHVLLTLLFLFTGHWFVFIFNVPLDLWFAFKCFTRRPGQLGFYDPVEVNNRSSIKAKMLEFLLRLPFYLICFCIYLFLLIQVLIQE